MKILPTSLLSSLCALALICAPEAQAALASNLASAYKRSNGKPIVAFFYGANYDKLSMRVHQEFVKRRKIMQAVGSATFVEIPIFQNPDAAEKRKAERALKGAKLPGGVRSYPSLVILDAQGAIRAQVTGSDMLDGPRVTARKEDRKLAGEALAAKNMEESLHWEREDERALRNKNGLAWDELYGHEKASILLESVIDKANEQEKYLKRAKRMRSGRKAELIGQAADIGLELPTEYREMAAAADEGNKEGLKVRFTFNWEELLPKIDKMDTEQADAYIRLVMASGRFMPEQRQELLCLLTGHLRRAGSVSNSRLKALYYEMYNIDPTSAYASYALEAIRIWLGEDPYPTEESEEQISEDKLSDSADNAEF